MSKRNMKEVLNESKDITVVNENPEVKVEEVINNDASASEIKIEDKMEDVIEEVKTIEEKSKEEQDEDKKVGKENKVSAPKLTDSLYPICEFEM